MTVDLTNNGAVFTHDRNSGSQTYDFLPVTFTNGCSFSSYRYNIWLNNNAALSVYGITADTVRQNRFVIDSSTGTDTNTADETIKVEWSLNAGDPNNPVLGPFAYTIVLTSNSNPGITQLVSFVSLPHKYWVIGSQTTPYYEDIGAMTVLPTSPYMSDRALLESFRTAFTCEVTLNDAIDGSANAPM